MSEIKFLAELDTAKLDAAIKQSNKTVGEWVRGVEKGSQSMDRAVENTVKQQKEAIKQQKDFIKGLTSEIKQMERDIENVTAGTAKRNAVKELRDAQRTLVEAKGDLNRIQNEAIKQNNEEETSQGKIIESLKKWGLGLLTVTGAMKAFKAVTEASNNLTEEFAFVIDGAKGALQQFLQSLNASSGSTGNVVTNIAKGFKGAKELSQAVDMYSDAIRANLVLEAKETEALKIQEKVFRDASNIPKERERALNEWIRIRKEAAQRELTIEKNFNEALLKEIKNRPNLKDITDKQIESFTTIFATNPDLVNKAQELFKLQTTAAGLGSEAVKKADNLANDIKKALPAGISFDDLMKSMSLNANLSTKQIEALSESFKRLYKAQGGESEVEAQVARWMGSIINKGDAAEKKISDIKLQIDNLTASLVKANESERKGIAEKIILLEKELKLQQDIVNAALMSATIREIPPSQIKGLKVPTLLPGGLKIPNTLAGKPTYDSGDYIPGTAMLSDSGKAKRKKEDAEYDRNREANLKKELDLRNQIVNSAADLVMQLGQASGLDQRSMEELGSSLDVWQKAMTGDWTGAAASLISGLVQLIPNEAHKFAVQIEHINFLIDQQQRLIAKSERFGGGKEALAGNIELLKQQEAALWNRFRLSGGKGAHEIRMQIEGVQDALVDAELALTDFLSGGVTENTLADAISQGMMDGADRGAEYLNNVLLDAVMNIFKEQLLFSPQMKIFSDNLKTFMADQVLTPEEVERLKKDQLDIINANKVGFDALTQGLDLGNGPQPGLTGAISRQITEETGSELAGLFRRFADDERVVKDYTIMGVNHLVGIEANTMNTFLELQKANIKLDTVISNTKQVPAGSL